MAIVRFDCYEVDLATLELRKRGARIRLREQSLQVLAMLLEHPGQLVTREDLQHRLWPHDVIVDFENNLNTAINRLREALGDSAEHPRFIETLPRHGYRFIAPVTVRTTVLESTGAPQPKARLLVLPFVNSSGDPSQEYFSDAMTDEIITELSALAPERLAVIARTTAMHYKGTHKDVARIGRELTLDYVVEGSVRRAGDRVALTVQLVRVPEEAHVLARRYDAELGEVFDLERSVAQELGEQIDTVPRAETWGAGGAVAPRGRRRPTEDLLAYNSYILGRYHFDKGESHDSWMKSRACFEDASTRDPRFAAAYDALAEWWWTAGFFGVIPPKETVSVGIVHAMRAVEIDPGLAEAHALLAQYFKQLNYNWAEVRREMELALELNPNSPIVLMRHAITGLMPFGRMEEAVANLERALELDPLRVFLRAWLVVMLWLGRQYERALEQGRLLLQFVPEHFLPHWVIGFVYRETGMFEQSIAAHRKAAELFPGPLMLGWLGLALAQSGDHAGARAIIERLRATPPTVYVPATSFAWIHIGLGEIDEFFEWVDRAIDERDHMIVPIKTYPFLDRIRDDPRYPGLLRKMNLA